jgi:hypothetical protein
MNSPTAKRHRTQYSIASTVDFAFPASEVISSISTKELSNLLKSKLVKLPPSEKYWNGRVVLTTVTPTTLTKGDTKVVFYDVFQETIVRCLQISFIVDEVVQFGKDILISHTREDRILKLPNCYNELYSFNTETTKWSQIMKTKRYLLCIVVLSNRTVAIGTDEGVLVLDKTYKQVKNVKLPMVYSIVELSSGNLAINCNGRVVLVCDKQWEQVLEKFDIYEKYSLSEIEPGILRAYWLRENKHTIINMSTQDQKHGSSKEAYLRLSNGLTVTYEHQVVSFHKDEELIFKETYQVTNTSFGFREVRPGVIIWQDDQYLNMYDVNARSMIKGYPRLLVDIRAYTEQIACILME